MFSSLFSQFIPWYLPNKPSCISNNKAFQRHIAMEFEFASFKSSPYSNILSKIPELIMISCWILSFISMASTVHSPVFSLCFSKSQCSLKMSQYIRKICNTHLIIARLCFFTKYINCNVVFIHFTPQIQNIWTKHLHKVDHSHLFWQEWGSALLRQHRVG